MPDSPYPRILLLLAALLTQAASAELAIIVRSNLSNDVPYHQALLENIGSETRSAFDSMSPRVYGVDEKPDNKPEFLLLVNHSGRFSVSSRPKRSWNGYKILEAGFQGRSFRTQTDRGTWSTMWTMRASQQHSLTFTFKKLQAGNYRTVQKWSMNLEAKQSSRTASGEVIVASLEQSTQGDFDRNPSCPLEISAAKGVAFARSAPENFGEDVLVGLLKPIAGRPYPLRVARNQQARSLLSGQADTAVSVSLKNSSPLPLTRITINVNYNLPGADALGSLLATHTFEPPLSPGKSIKVELQGSSLRAYNRRAPGLRIINAKFSDPE